MQLERMIATRDQWLDEEIGELETDDGWLRIGHVYRQHGQQYRLEKMTRRGWYGLSASTSKIRFFPWQWTVCGSIHPRRVVDCPYPVEPSDRKPPRASA
jgi:hypothetical protein